jgi:ABC-type glycerol-3-phosphate transport system substrate-binding protein
MIKIENTFWKIQTLQFNISLVFLLLIFFSCKKEESTSNSKLTNVQVSSEVNWIGHWKNAGKREQLVREVANEFEFLNQNIKVNLKFPEEVYFFAKPNSHESDVQEVTFIAEQVTSTKPKWDIIRLKDHYPRVAIFLNDPDWGKKYLVDFSEFTDFKDKHQSFVFNKEYKDANGGITIGPYNEGFYFAVFYNKDLADKMGIKIKQFGMTPDDFISYIKAVYDYNKSHGTDIVPMFEQESWVISPMLVYNMFYSLVGDYNEIVNPEYNPKKLEYLEKVLRVFEEISKYDPLPKDRSKISSDLARSFPLDEKCLLYPQGSWMYAYWHQIDKIKLRNMIPAELPSFTDHNPAYIGGYKACWAVPKNAPHKEEAIKLLKFWANEEVAEKWVRYTKCPTAVKGAVTTTTLGFDQFEDYQYYIIKKYGLHMLNPVDNSCFFGEKNKTIAVPVMDIIEKKQTVDEVMANIKKQIH